MKLQKTLISGLILGALLIPSFGLKAQTAVDPNTISSATDVESLKSTLISLLTQLIAQLQAQIAELQTQQANTANVVQNIQISTPTQTEIPTTGTVTPTTPQLDPIVFSTPDTPHTSCILSDGRTTGITASYISSTKSTGTIRFHIATTDTSNKTIFYVGQWFGGMQANWYASETDHSEPNITVRNSNLVSIAGQPTPSTYTITIESFTPDNGAPVQGLPLTLPTMTFSNCN